MKKSVFALLLSASVLTACAGAPSYHYAFDPNFRFTPPKTYAWYDDPDDWYMNEWWAYPESSYRAGDAEPICILTPDQAVTGINF